MSTRPLLEGQIEVDETPALRRQIERLKQEIESLRDALTEARAQGDIERRAAAAKRTLKPLYGFMRALFDELDGFEEDAGSTALPQRVSAVWDSWISKLGGKSAEFIKAMLEHQHPIILQQLRVATHTGRSTVPQIIYKLNQLRLINKENGKYSLKQL